MRNSSKEIKKIIDKKNFNKILLITGKNSFGACDGEILKEEVFKNKKYLIYFKNSEIPVYDELIKITKKIQSFKPDLILAIGGGTVIDYAKMSNVVDIRPDLPDLINNYSFPFNNRKSKLAVIPTTAGSGAEVTSNAVIYLKGIKYSFESNLLIPDYFLLFPEFLISAPKKIKASAGFDAIAQALESLISRKSNTESVNFASKSLDLSLKNYISFLESPTLENAEKMSIASNLAGKAINISKTTAPHATSYPFTYLFNISHGHAVSLFFEKFFSFNFENLSKSDVSFSLKDRFDLIFRIFCVGNIKELCDKINNIKKKADLDDNLSNLGVDLKQNFDEILNGINLLRLGNNPVKIDKEILKKIIFKED